jgi:tetratricopeptide (TPR) repeat protein
MDSSQVPLALIATVLAAPALSPLPQGESATLEAFESGLVEAHRLMGRGDWDDARAHVLSLLDEHEGETYVFERFPTVREDLIRCAFWKEHEEPKAKAVISGRLISYGAASGKIKLRYTGETLDDFEPIPYPKNYRLHPLTFDGPYTVEIKWKGTRPTGKKRPRILTGYKTSTPIGVALGADVTLTERVSGEWWDLKTQPFQKSVKIVRKKKNVLFYVDGKKVHTQDIPKPEYGQIALLNFDKVKGEVEILIHGDGQPSWLEGAVDKAVSKTWSTFEEGYDLNAELPVWLAEANAGAIEEFCTDYPGPRTEGQEELWKEGWNLVLEQDYGKLIKFEDELDDDCSSVFRKFWRAWVEYLRGDLEDAEKACNKVLKSEPGHAGTRMLQVYIDWSRDGMDRAIEGFGELYDKEPTNVDVINNLVTVLMWDGQTEEARAIPREALRAGVPIGALSKALSMLGKADRGPDWQTVHEFKSAHYHVMSDINVKMCSDAAKQLEAALKFYSRDLRAPPSDDNLYEVYIFSGQRGYEDYTEDLMGSAVENTLGLYTPSLKQLLIWNVPEREDMLRTIRHEGFHQYLDRLLDVTAPRWLNEGIAEYYETAQMLGSKTHTGAPHRYNLDMLQGWGTPDMEEFFELPDGAFMASPLSYPSSWGIVHFLLESGEEERALFDELIDRMMKGESGKEAVEHTFEKVDMKKLRIKLGTHLRKL